MRLPQRLWQLPLSAILAIALSAATLSGIAGCQKPEPDDTEPAKGPTAVQFTGQPDKKFAGDWITADKASEIDLKPDGTLKITSNVHRGKSVTVSECNGSWAVDGDALVLKYKSQNDASETVTKYTAALAASQLTLSQGIAKVKTVYNKRNATSASP